MMSVRYGTSAATAFSAAGVTGFLLKQMDGSFFFRIYAANGKFTDYDIRHDDLEVTIAPDVLASFYHIGEGRLLDHSPEVLDLDITPNDQEF